MKQEEIIEGNQLIAEFMGDDFFANLGFTYQRPMFKEGRILPEHCKFHSSWDWLMRAVEKIESLGFRFGIALNSVDLYDIISQRFSTTVNVDESYGIKNESFKKIESTWLAVVEFIKWYNNKD